MDAAEATRGFLEMILEFHDSITAEQEDDLFDLLKEAITQVPHPRWNLGWNWERLSDDMDMIFDLGDGFCMTFFDK